MSLSHIETEEQLSIFKRFLSPERFARLEALIEAKKELRRICLAMFWTPWNHAKEPSQHAAFKTAIEGTYRTYQVRGGNRAGKTTLGVIWSLCVAAGKNATISTGDLGTVYWVRELCDGLGIDWSDLSEVPRTVWVGSRAFSDAIAVVRPALQKYAPVGSSFHDWAREKEATLILPGGGMIVSKAFEQYDRDPASWEGSALGGFWLDEEPQKEQLLESALWRCVDYNGRGLMTMTPLRGKTWTYRRFVVHPGPKDGTIELDGENNTHIPQDVRAEILSHSQPWQREARAKGAYTTPAGLVFPMFNSTQHIANINTAHLKPHWPRFCSIDWGSWAPHVLWICKVPKGNGTPFQKLYGGKFVVYREYAPRAKSGSSAASTDEKVIQRILDVQKAADERSIQWTVADAAGKSAIITALQKGIEVYKCLKYNGSVTDGIDLLTSALVDSRIVISKDCKILISEMEGYSWAAKQEVDEPTEVIKKDDHGIDAIMYFLNMAQRLGDLQ